MPAKSIQARPVRSRTRKPGASPRPARDRRPSVPSIAAAAPPPVTGVLDRFGRALGAGDLPGVAACFAYPSLFLTGADTHEFRDPQQVQTVFAAALEGQAAINVVSRRPEVEAVSPLGNGIYACTVRWPGFDADGKRILEEKAHYVIQESTVGTALIRVAVAMGAPPERG